MRLANSFMTDGHELVISVKTLSLIVTLSALSLVCTESTITWGPHVIEEFHRTYKHKNTEGVREAERKSAFCFNSIEDQNLITIVGH